MRRGGVSTRREECRGRPGLGHAERREDAVLHEIVPVLAGDGGEDLAGHDVQHVVVRVGAAEARHGPGEARSEEHTSELQSQSNLVCRLLLEKKKKKIRDTEIE